jgi:hypothetical protein
MSTPLVAVAVAYLSPGPALLAVTAPALVAKLAMRKARAYGTAHVIARRAMVAMAGVIYVEVASIELGSPRIPDLLLMVAAVVIADFFLAQVQSSYRLDTSLLSLLLGSSRLQGAMLLANTSAGSLALLLYSRMGAWGLGVLVMLLLVMRQAFTMLLSVRQAYQYTIEALASTVEAGDPAKGGHAERVSRLATEAGREFGFRGHELERLAYAALLHDLAEVGTRKEGELGGTASLAAAEMLRGVTFLEDVLPVLQIGEGKQSELEGARPSDVQMAYSVLLASRNDDLVHGRPTEQDSTHLMLIDPALDTRVKRRLDRAFRAAMSKVEGSAVAYSGDSGSGGAAR